jgi:hypothetical protein
MLYYYFFCVFLEFTKRLLFFTLALAENIYLLAIARSFMRPKTFAMMNVLTTALENAAHSDSEIQFSDNIKSENFQFAKVFCKQLID